MIIFAGGGATGWGLSILYRPGPPMFMGPPTPPVDDMVGRLREELLLTDDQARQVKDIYQQRNDALQAIREQMGPQLKSQYDKLSEQMKQVLTPQQFQRWHERFESIRSRMLPPPPPPGGRGPGGPERPGGWRGPGLPGGAPPNEPPPGGPPDGPPPL